MDAFEAKRLAESFMSKHGLISNGWKFRYNTRKRSAGICSYRHSTIELSLLLTRLSNVVDVTDTILHEIAHALVGSKHGHDAVWQRKAIEIGCNGKRCYGEDKESTYEAYKTIAKYKGTCCNGHEHFRNRKPTKKHSCGKCSRRFEEKYVINWSLA
jgi:predicted SprT family Zn-dependent metalloprotease